MIKLMLTALVLMTFCLTVISAPPKGQNGEQTRLTRIGRVTCDLLWFMGDTACAGHCLSLGQAGGHCTDGICHCRSEKFKDVWDREFPNGATPWEMLHDTVSYVSKNWGTITAFFGMSG